MKRFWTETAVTEADEGFGVALDGKPISTPAKQPVLMPSRAMADAFAAEWEAVEGEVRPDAMPVTKAVNATLDRVIGMEQEVAEAITAYGETDLLCYRAPHPPELAARQTAAWDPLLDWAREAYGAQLFLAEGVMHIAQPENALRRLAAEVTAHDAWALTGLYALVTLSGSLVIGLAVRDGRMDAEAAWETSRVDEQWNIDQWGEDADAARLADARRTEFLAGQRFLALALGSSVHSGAGRRM